jgi:hypothetical protein
MNHKITVGLACAAVALLASGSLHAQVATIFNQLQNPSTGACLDSLGKAGATKMYACHGQGGNQKWIFDPTTSEVRNPSTSLCLDAFGKDHVVMAATCTGKGGNQAWTIAADRGEFKNPSTGQCLDSLGKADGNPKMYNCHGKKGNQEWR